MTHSPPDIRKTWIPSTVVVVSLAASAPFLILGSLWTNLTVGGLTPQAVLAIILPLLFAGALVATWKPLTQRPPSLPVFQRPHLTSAVILTSLLVWILWQWINLLVLTDVTVSGLQSVLLGTLTALGIVFFARAGANLQNIHYWLAGFGLLGSLIIIVQELLGWGAWWGQNNTQYLLIPLVSLFALASTRPMLLFATPLVLQALIIGNGRMFYALGILVFIFAAIALPHLRFIPRLLIVITAVAMIPINIASRTSFVDRWAIAGDNGVTLPEWVPILGTAIPQINEAQALNTSGRIDVWTALIGEITTSTWLIGNGAGFSRDFVAELADWAQPHNEYLRLFLDFGLLGLLLWLIPLLGFVVLSFAKWRTAPTAAWSLLAATGCLAGLSLTDLTMVSVGFMLPFALLAGALISALSESTTERNRSSIDAE